ncbi:MAG: DUF1697 domain-containing protein [Chitinophagaceae bacterium]|nr:MAG: DUF1697 domain-containing protein [Chitinophagaceae bacterium]
MYFGRINFKGLKIVYVALLRGINVGGNNQVEMKKLKTTFELPGFTNVVTHIYWGNIIFECVSVEQGITANKIEKAIKKDFRSDIKVLLRSFKNIETICKKLTVT